MPYQRKDLALDLVKVHDDRFSSPGGDKYFACVDMKGADGNIYDIDFFMVVDWEVDRCGYVRSQDQRQSPLQLEARRRRLEKSEGFVNAFRLNRDASDFGKRSACLTKIRLAVRHRFHLAHEKYCRAGAPPANLLRWVILLAFPFGCAGNDRLSISLQFVSPIANRFWLTSGLWSLQSSSSKASALECAAAVHAGPHARDRCAKDARDTNLGNFSQL